MIVLSGTTESIAVTLGGSTTTSPVELTAAYVDLPAHTPVGFNTTKSTATAATLVSAPGSSVQRVIDYLSICNTDTASVTVTFFHDSSGTARRLWRGVLAANESAIYSGDRGWRVFDATGERKVNMDLGAPPANDIDDVLGSDLAAWFRADQGLTLTGSDVDSFADITGNVTLTPQIGGLLFQYEASGFNGQPSIVTSGGAGLSGVMSSPLLASSRPYVWIVAQYTSLTDAYLLSVHSTGDTRWVALGEYVGDWEGAHNAVGGSSWTSFASSTSDTNRHLFEGGFTVGGTDAFVVSDVGTSSPETAAPDANLTTIRLNNMNGTITGVAIANFRGAEIIVSRAIPTSGQRADIIAILEDRYGSL